MKMSKQFIYASDIVKATSVIGLLDGTEQFCFENPYFNVAGITKPDKKSFLDTASGNTKFGVILRQINIYYKGTNNVFTNRYAIGYTETVRNGERVDKNPKEYVIMKPFDVTDLGDRQRHKLLVSPVNVSREDLNLLTMDYQFTMVMDVLCIAKILNIDLAKYAGQNNVNFYRAFIIDINEILKEKGAKKTIEYDDILVSSFDNPPVFSKSSRNDIIPIYDLENNLEPAFNTLFTSFYESVSQIKSKLKGWEKVLQRANCAAFPTIKYTCFEKKTSEDEITEHGKRFDCRLTFIIQLSAGDKGFNPKFPDSLVTRQQISRTKIEKLTKTTLPKLWGGSLSDDDTNTRATQKGCLYIIPRPLYSYFEKGSPTIEWRVEKIATQRIQNDAMNDYDEGIEFLDGAGNENVPTNEENRNNEDINFLRNENEIDPDALI